ncbi:FG-GAP-like repeat-containing protein [Streptomyces sp. T-3]|nr:FG-GAP-like repeat-containing protein [Streptomyces sp. T-3]
MAGLVAVVPQGAAAVGSSETVVPATLRATPRADLVVLAGDSGFLHQREGYGVRWTPYDDPDASQETGWLTGDSSKYANNGAWGDVVASPSKIGSTTTVTFRDMRDGTQQKLVLPAGQSYAASFGTTVLSVTYSGSEVTSWHLLTLKDGQVQDRPVTGFPAGATLRARPAAANEQGLYTSYTVDGVSRPAWVDLARASATPVLAGHQQSGARSALVGDRLSVWHTDGSVSVFDTADFSRPVRTFTVPYETNARLLGLSGDALLIARYDVPADGATVRATDRVHRIVAVPADGAAERTLLTRASAEVDVARDGSMVVVAGSDPEAATVQRITVTDGLPSADKVTAIPAVRSESAAASVANGRLLTVDSTLGMTLSLNRRTVSVTSPPTYSAATAQEGGSELRWADCFRDFPCPELRATGDGRMVAGDNHTDELLLVPADGGQSTPLGTTLHQAQLDDASGRFALVRGWKEAAGEFYVQVVDLDKNAPLRTLPDGDYALWGRTLWQRGSTAGTLVPMDVTTGAKGTAVGVGSGCTGAYGMKASGDWLYWACAGGTAKAGLKNLATGRQTTLARRADALGDGWIASLVGDAVVVDDVTSGTPAEVTRFTPKGTTLGRDWVADPYGGPLAWVDAQENVHIVRVGTGTMPLAQTDADTPATAAVKGGEASWKARWWLSKPAASWKLTLKNKATGVTVRTFTGGETRGAVSAAWNGTTASDALVANGTYSWSLTAQAADGQGAALVRTGTVKLTGAAAVRRDHVGGIGPDGTGDLLTLNSSGAFTFQHGDGAGKFAGKTSGSGWSTKSVAVPFGDLNGDRCNDVLVRMSDGSLRGYKPGCGKALTTSTPYTKLGTGWSAYNVLTSPGDLTGDGRADLLARKAATGDIYVFAAKSDGTLAAGKEIRSGWTTYTKIFGAGDLNGDGHGDLLARHKDGTLYRYDGLGNGLLKDRVKVFSGWGASYDAIVGVGDISGDGRADLVARDTSGNVWRQNGDGRGSFGARTEIATGWGTYKGLF